MEGSCEAERRRASLHFGFLVFCFAFLFVFCFFPRPLEKLRKIARSSSEIEPLNQQVLK